MEEVHPLLKGGGPIYSHGFSRAEITVLHSLCETFIPCFSNSIADPASHNDHPDYIAGLFTKHFPKELLLLVRFVLVLLSTGFGTLLLGGTQALSHKTSSFPYPRKFAALPLQARESILLSWSLGTGSMSDPLFAVFFKAFKTMCLYTYFSKANEDGQNPAWTAIGYSIPPRPRSIPQSGPLDGGIIDVSDSSLEQVKRFLDGVGFQTCWSRGRLRLRLVVKCDVVVVGSGAGGSVVAATLAQKGWRVVVVEQGKYFGAGQLSLLEGPSMGEMYARGGLLTTTSGSVSIMAGTTLGGGTAINWSACVRTPAPVLHDWAHHHGLPLFDSTHYTAAMDHVCSRLGVAAIPLQHESFQNRVLRKGCKALGYKVKDVPINAPPPHGCGSCGFGCPSDDKRSTPRTWLHDLVNASASGGGGGGGGGRILSGCRATKILLRRRRHTGGAGKPRVACGVECAEQGIVIEATATVAAGGALMTPTLLKQSGLRNGNIGRNLHLHPARLAWGYFPDGAEPPGHTHLGPILTSMCDGDGDFIVQTPAMAPGAFAAVMPWISREDFGERMRRYHRTAHLFALARDRGCGKLVGSSGLRVHYEPDDADVANITAGLERALRILVAAGATMVGTHHADGVVFEVEGKGTGAGAGASQPEFDAFVRRLCRSAAPCPLTSAHQMGSCRMGPTPQVSAVDPAGECWEAAGLFVADASLFPTALGVNPMITVQSLALLVSRHVAAFLTNHNA